MSSAILKQIEQLKEALQNTAEWEDLVSVEDISKKTGDKSIQAVKDILNDKGLKPVGKIGKTYLYARGELLKAIRIK
jgi:hypothetical protein